MKQVYLVTVHIDKLSGEEIEVILGDLDKSRIHSVEKYQLTYYSLTDDPTSITEELERQVNARNDRGVMKINDNHFLVCLQKDGDIRYSNADHSLAGDLFRTK